MFNLRNRSFLKELDFSSSEFEYLLRLAAASKRRSTRVPSPATGGQGDRSDLREDLHPHSLGVRGRRL